MKPTDMTFPLQGKTTLTKEEILATFFRQIDADQRFEKSFHLQYMALQPRVSWYTGPESSRDMAHRLTGSLMDRIWSVLYGDACFGVTGTKQYTAESGCLRVCAKIHDDWSLALIVEFTTHDTTEYRIAL